MILYQSSNGKVEWDESKKVVVKSFSGLIHGEDLRNAFNAGYNKMLQKHGIKWLSDNRKLESYKLDDIKWINEDWFPRMLSIGWKYWALIEPKTQIGAIVMNKFKFYADKGIIINVFEQKDKSFEWLDSFKS